MKTNVKRTVKSISAAILIVCLALSLVCCNTATYTSDENSNNATTGVAGTVSTTPSSRPSVNPDVKKDTENPIGYQLEAPKDGDTIAILHTNYGDITWRFFPESAPKAVDNFIKLAQAGKYDNTIFHRVYKDFMIQGGDYENSNGTGGTSAFGEAFEDEFSTSLYNIRGSVAMANSGANTNGSQFFINQSSAESFSRNSVTKYDDMYASAATTYNQYVAQSGDAFTSQFPTVEAFIEYCGGINPLDYAISEEVYKLYEENGGNIHLDGALRASGGHTVFAQVIEGMDVVDAIANVEVTENSAGEKSQPVKDVIIETVEITTYKAD